jgi:thioredoxin
MSMLGGGVRGGGRGGGAGGVGGGGGGGGAGKSPQASEDITWVTEREFEREILRSELPVFIEFTADWCAPCKQIAPEVDALAREMRGKIKVVKIDIDKAPLLARELRVQSVPTFMMFAEGRIVDAQVGAISKKQMRAMVDPFLPRAAGALKPIELAQLIREGQVSVVDTRDASAFGRAHIPGASNMPFDEIEGRLAELHMLPAQPVLYCRAGDKTKELAATLAEQGVPVAFVEGGFLGWESEGLPVERP